MPLLLCDAPAVCRWEQDLGLGPDKLIRSAPTGAGRNYSLPAEYEFAAV